MKPSSKIFRLLATVCHVFYITGGDPIPHPKFWQLAQMPPKVFLSLNWETRFISDAGGVPPPEGLRRSLKIPALAGRSAETHDRIRRPGPSDETLAVIPLPGRRHRRGGDDHRLPLELSGGSCAGGRCGRKSWDIFAFARYCPDRKSRDTCCSSEEYHWMMNECWEKFQQYKRTAARPSTQRSSVDAFQYEKGLFDPNDRPDDGICL